MRCLLPVCALVLAAAPTVRASAQDDNAETTVLPPVVVHPGEDPMRDLDRRLRELGRGLPDLGYKKQKEGRRPADLEESSGFKRQMFTQMLEGFDPRLQGPPAPYIPEGDSELSRRTEDEFSSAERARRRSGK